MIPSRPNLAGLLEELGAVADEVFGVADLPALRRWQQFLQQLLAFFERDIPQVHAIEVQQIKDVIDEVALLAFR